MKMLIGGQKVRVVLSVVAVLITVSFIGPNTILAESNPHDLVFLSDQKAYVLRYGTDTVWIVNPSAATDANFKIGEIDLSSYADADGIPEMWNGIIVGKYLYIILQKLDRDNFWSATDKASVLIIDTDTDSVEKEVFLNVPNPVAIQYVVDDGLLYIACAGNLYDHSVDNGIVTVDPGTYDVNKIIDGLVYTGSVAGLFMVSGTKGYFIDYSYDFNTYTSSSNLYTFDPTDLQPLEATVNGFTDIQIGGMESGVSLDKNGMLWVCNQTTGQVDLLDTSNDEVDERVSTNLNPLKVAFVSDGVDQYGVVATAAADYSSGAHSVISVDTPRTVQNDLDPSGSDVTVVAYGRYFYRLERSNANSITKYNISFPDRAIWQFSTEDQPLVSDDDDDDAFNCFINTLR